jgi:hypothetical protein
MAEQVVEHIMRVSSLQVSLPLFPKFPEYAFDPVLFATLNAQSISGSKSDLVSRFQVQ